MKTRLAGLHLAKGRDSELDPVRGSPLGRRAFLEVGRVSGEQCDSRGFCDGPRNASVTLQSSVKLSDSQNHKCGHGEGAKGHTSSQPRRHMEARAEESQGRAGLREGMNRHRL